MPVAEEPDSPQEIDPLAEEVDGIIDADEQSEAELVAAWEAHSGPLPNARWFEALEQIQPGVTEAIVRDYTEEREHQRRMQAEALRIDEQSLGQFSRYQFARLLIAGGIAAFLAIAGVALIFFHEPIAGFILLVAEITGLVLAFLGRRRDIDDGADEDEIGPL